MPELVNVDGRPMKLGAPQVLMLAGDGTTIAVDFATFCLQVTQFMGGLAHGILKTPEEGNHEGTEGEVLIDAGTTVH